jgi:hypothetical protein
MTFTEAALEVLRREGKPLHFRKIAELAIRENLLDHVGKIPEEIMADQLMAHARLPHVERRLVPVQQGTFALAEWGLDEDPKGLEGLLEPPADEGLPYRGRERHPIPLRELARGGGRAEQRARREEERRQRRFPPPAEVAYEILAGAGRALRVDEIAAQGAERLLMPDAFVRDAGSLLAALAEDNRRREAAGRQPLFALGDEGVSLVAQPEPGERPAPLAPRAAATAADLRRAALAALRRRLREADGATVEWIAARLLEKLGYRELKGAKRGREHVVLTARRRMGLAEIRHAVRVLRAGGEAGRREVAELRRDLGHHGAQVGVLVTAGDATREARGEATAAGQLPIVLLCGEAFAEALADAGLGTVPVVVPEIDDAFFRAAAEAAERDEAARRARREEREGRGEEPREGRGRDRGERRERRDEPRGRERDRERAEGAPAAASDAAPADAEHEPIALPEPEPEAGEAAAGAVAPASPREREPLLLVAAGADEDAEDEGDDEDGEDGDAEEPGAAEAAEGSPQAAAGGEPQGERRRRRRRRRRRGGRGRGREGAAPGAQAAQAAPGGAEAGAQPAAPAAPEPPAPAASDPTPGGEGA